MRSKNEELLRGALAGVLRKVGVLRSDVDPSSPDLIRMSRRYTREPDLPLFREKDRTEAEWLAKLGFAPPSSLDDDIPF
jgi:hypothetical protein